MLVKNSYGSSLVLGEEIENKIKHFNEFTGSSLNRNKKVNEVQQQIDKKLIDSENLKSMSSRTKSKIRKKLMALSGIFKRLSFVTLTFVNLVDDKNAVDILRKFLDNIKKRSKDFQYLWVAERQTNNEVFKDNIHFHLVTNKYWDIKKIQPYWLKLQKKNGIFPRQENYNPSSVFDVKQLISNDIKGVSNYVTKYVTKNISMFKCQVWNCSKKISAIYTGFYTNYDFLKQLHIVCPDIKEIPLEYCNLHLVPLNRTTRKMYNRLDEKNKKVWNSSNKL